MVGVWVAVEAGTRGVVEFWRFPAARFLDSASLRWNDSLVELRCGWDDVGVRSIFRQAQDERVRIPAFAGMGKLWLGARFLGCARNEIWVGLCYVWDDRWVKRAGGSRAAPTREVWWLHGTGFWISAFAGMTRGVGLHLAKNYAGVRGDDVLDIFVNQHK